MSFTQDKIVEDTMIERTENQSVYMPTKAALTEKPLREAIDSFISLLPSGNTKQSYGYDLEIFLSFLEKNGFSDMRTGEVVALQIARFRDAETERVASSTLRRRLFALRSFFKWAVEQGYIHRNPATLIELPRKSGFFPCHLTEEEIDRILSAPDHRKTIGIRDRAMISMGYHCGLRVSELCSLKLDSIRLEHFKYKKKLVPAVVVEGKGGKTRDIPINDDAFSDLKDWVDVRPEVDIDDLFILRNGNPMTPAAFRYILKKHAKKAGVDRRVTPHMLRHSFATHLAACKVRLDLISEYLGHSNLKETQAYLHLTDDEYSGGVLSLASTQRKKGF